MKWGWIWDSAKDVLLMVLVCFLLFGGRVQLSIGRKDGRVQHDTVAVRYDTIPFYFPVPKDSTVLRFETVRLPVKEIPDKMPPLPEDSAEVEIPITQKVYEDSTYRAYVSGFNPKLDSLFVYPKNTVVTLHKRPKRWSVGLSTGYGYGKNGLSPFIGVSLQYKLFEF